MPRPYISQLLISFIIISAIIYALLLSGYAEAQGWEITRQEWITVYHHQGDRRNLPAIFQAVEAEYRQISANLGLEFKGELNIYLASRPAEFGELTGWKLPQWTQGVAFPERNLIVLKSPRYSGSQIDLSRAAVHEFIHILLHRGTGRIPVWLNEGLAVMLSGEGYFDDTSLSRASLTGRYIPFQQIEAVQGFDPQEAQLAYQQSLSAVRYLVAQFGWGAVRKLLERLKHGAEFQKAFFEATGLWPDEFEGEWMKEAGSRYRFSFLKDIHFIIGFVFIPLLLLGGFAVWWRRRKIVRRWEEEESVEDYGDVADL